MPSRNDWIIGGIIVAALAAVGITLYLTRKKPAEGYHLKRIGVGQPILTNLERVKLIRNRDGSLSELVIHRTVESA